LPQAGAVSGWFEHEPVRKRVDQFAAEGTTRRRRSVHRADPSIRRTANHP
jgi:hypothetical protein